MHTTTSKGFHLRVRQILTALIAMSILVAFTSIAKADPIHDAAEAGDIKKTKQLLDSGADINAKNNYGLSPLHLAAKHSSAEIIEFLIERSADVNAQANNGRTPLHEAASFGNFEAIKLLLEQGANVNAKINNSRTPLHMAAGAFSPSTSGIKLLIEYGTDVNVKDKKGWTPLHLSAVIPKGVATKQLIKLGADIHAKNNNGKTTLDLARKYKRPKIEKYLQSVINGTIKPRYVKVARKNYTPKKSAPRKPTAPPNITASIKFSEPSGNKILDADETGTLTIKVSNKGKGPAYDVVVKLTPNKKLKGLKYPKTVKIGTVPSGKAVKAKIKLTAANSIPTSKVRFTIEAMEANGYDADAISFAFNTKSFSPPKLVVAATSIDDQSGNRKIEPMEVVEMTVRVQNMGYGEARGVKVIVKNGKNVFISGDLKTTLNIGNLKPGEYKDVSFMFHTNKRIKSGQPIPLALNITEQRKQFNTMKSLTLAMNARQKSVKEFTVQGQDTSPTGAITLATGLSGSAITSTVDTPPKRKMKKNPNAYAVVIGIEKYREQLPDAPYATRDAETVAKYLTTSMGFERRNVKVLINERATKSDIEKTLGPWLKNRANKSNSKVFIYFSGHGAPDVKTKSAYIVPYNGDPTYIANTGYSLDKLYKTLDKLKSKEIIVALDSCFSGAGGRSVIAKGARPLAMEFETPLAKSGKIVVLSASSGKQISSSYEAEGHGLFTYYMLKGLQGSADKNKNGKIDLQELHRYIKPQVQTVALEEYNNDQTPQLIDINKQGGKITLIGK